MNTPSGDRKTIARKPSHFGSYRNAPDGIASASFASMGSTGGTIIQSRSRTARASSLRLAADRRRRVVKRIEVPVEKRPDPVPRVALLARVLGLPCLGIDAAIERVSARRVVVHHRLGEERLPRPQGIDQLHVLFDVHVLVVLRY